MTGSPGTFGKSIDLREAPVCTNGESECVRRGRGRRVWQGQGHGRAVWGSTAGVACPRLRATSTLHSGHGLHRRLHHDVAHENRAAPALRLGSVGGDHVRTGRAGCGRDPGPEEAGRARPPPPPAPWPGVAAPRLHPECATVCFHAAFVACLVLRYCGPSEVMRMRCQVPEGSTVRGFTSVRPALSRNAPIRDRPARGLRPRWSWGSRPARWGPQAGPACRQHPLQPGLRF